MDLSKRMPGAGRHGLHVGEERQRDPGPALGVGFLCSRLERQERPCVSRSARLYGVYAPIVPLAVEPAVWQHLNRVIAGTESPQSAIASAREQARTLLVGD